MEEPRDDVAAAEAARAQAEARRKRILEKAEKRMGAVSGEQTQDSDEKKGSVSKAARIRAARQRRYGKKGASSSGDATSAEVATAEPTLSDNSQKVESGPENESSPNVGSPGKESSNEVLTQESKVIEGSDTLDSSGSLAKETPKKKYIGVARMRRKMLKEKKEEEKTTNSTKSESADLQSTKTAPTPVPSFTKTTLPIYMHIVTVFLLFFAGLNVGWQQPLHKGAQIESKLSLMQNGLPLINRPMHSTPKSRLQSTEARILGETALTGENLSSFDEFQDDEKEDEPNIDPLFRVDLDKLTEGPGMMNALARRAISLHRLILWLLYYGPIGVLQAVIGMPQALLRFPPSLCLIGLTIRQFIGKSILGAKIPELENLNDKGGTIDIVSMAKNFVATFFTSNFPTAFGMYDAFNHLRADMYIMLCGLFTGIVWVHLLGSGPALDGKLINEEL